METLTAYKFRLDPNKEQTKILYNFAGAARYCYNAYVADMKRRNDIRETCKEQIIKSGIEDKKEINKRLKEINDGLPQPYKFNSSPFDFQNNWLTPMREHHKDSVDGWLHNIPRRIQVSGITNAGKALDNFFKSVSGNRKGNQMGFPKFKSKYGARDSFTIPVPENMGVMGTKYDRNRKIVSDHRHAFITYIGLVRTHNSTKRLYKALKSGGQLRSYTVSRNADSWYVSFLVKSDVTPKKATKKMRKNGAVGIDLGVKELAVLSSGEVIPNQKVLLSSEVKLVKAQKSLSSKVKGSANRKKASRKVAKLHHLTALRRRTILDTMTKKLVTSFESVALEDLNVSGMLSKVKPKADPENVGQYLPNGRAAKSGLSKSISDASFATVRSMLEYKSEMYGSNILIIDRFMPSSKTCNSCGSIKDMPLSLREYVCDCGYRADRDLNAARNIRDFALANQKRV